MFSPWWWLTRALRLAVTDPTLVAVILQDTCTLHPAEKRGTCYAFAKHYMCTSLMQWLMTMNNYCKACCNGLKAFNDPLVMQLALCGTWLHNLHSTTPGCHFTLLPRCITYVNIITFRHEACPKDFYAQTWLCGRTLCCPERAQVRNPHRFFFSYDTA